jgi:hypothetical protein
VPAVSRAMEVAPPSPKSMIFSVLLKGSDTALAISGSLLTMITSVPNSLRSVPSLRPGWRGGLMPSF